MKSSCLLALTVLVSLSISAQKSFEPGYIVTLSGDTVTGQINFNTESALAQTVFFREGNNDNGKTRLPTEIAGFGFSHTAYRSLKFVNSASDSAITETKFCRLIEDGRVRLYALPEGENYFYLVQREQEILFLYSAQMGRDGDTRKEANYRNILTIVSSECMANDQKAETVIYAEKQLAGFIHRLNGCLSPDSSRSYREKPRLIKSLVASAGGMKYTYGSQLTGSLLFRLVNTGFSPKLSLNAGLLYADKNDGLQETYLIRPNSTIIYYPHRLYVHQRLFSVPVTVQWIFSTGRVQPFFYGGLGFAGYREHRTERQFDNYNADEDLHYKGTVILGAGIDARLVAQLYLRVEGRIEGYIHYPTAGLSYRFNW